MPEGSPKTLSKAGVTSLFCIMYLDITDRRVVEKTAYQIFLHRYPLVSENALRRKPAMKGSELS